jgi:uncharacterized protein
LADLPAISATLHAALVTGDTTALGSLFREDVVVWHNNDRVEIDGTTALGRISALSQIAKAVTLETVRFIETDVGFVEQIVIRGTLNATGKPLELHNCLLVSVVDGKIERIDEYVDPMVARQPAG